MEKFHQRVALVTGAASGIGAAICKALALNGMHVAACDINEDSLLKCVADIDKATVEKPNHGKCSPFVCDITKEADISSMFEKIKTELGGVDVCVCAAGVGHKAPILTGNPELFRNMWEVNVMGYVLCCQMAFQQMQEKGVDDGHMILISSGAGRKVRGGTEAFTHFNFYNATKHAITAVAEGIRFELRMKKSNIRITTVSPGIVETKFTHKMYPGEEASVDELYASIKCLQPDDVANGVLYALSQPQHVMVEDVLLRPVEQLQ